MLLQAIWWNPGSNRTCHTANESLTNTSIWLLNSNDLKTLTTYFSSNRTPGSKWFIKKIIKNNKLDTRDVHVQRIFVSDRDFNRFNEERSRLLIGPPMTPSIISEKHVISLRYYSAASSKVSRLTNQSSKGTRRATRYGSNKKNPLFFSRK